MTPRLFPLRQCLVWNWKIFLIGHCMRLEVSRCGKSDRNNWSSIILEIFLLGSDSQSGIKRKANSFNLFWRSFEFIEVFNWQLKVINNQSRRVGKWSGSGRFFTQIIISFHISGLDFSTAFTFIFSSLTSAGNTRSLFSNCPVEAEKRMSLLVSGRQRPSESFASTFM